MSIKHQETLSTCRTRARVLVEVLDPIDANTVIRLAGFREIDRPFGQERAVAVPAFKVGFACNHQVQRDDFTIRPYGLDRRNPFPIARLDLLCPPTAFRRGNNESRRDLAHQKPRFVEVPDIRLENPMLRDSIAEKVEPRANYLWIFAFGPLVVVRTRQTRPEC